MKIKILGALGGRIPGQELTGFLIDAEILVDAGSAGASLSASEQAKIKYLLLSHSHLDHIYSLSFLLESRFYLDIPNPLEIYASQETLEVLKENFLIEDFISPLVKENLGRLMNFKPLEPKKEYQIGSYLVKPVYVNHHIGSMGFFISDGETEILYTGDLGPSEELWQEVKNHHQLKLILIEVSFPNRMEEIAILSKHLTPALLQEELKKADVKDKEIYLFHLKPNYFDLLFQEISEIQGYNIYILKQGQVIDLEKEKPTFQKDLEQREEKVPRFDPQKDLYEQRASLEKDFGVRFSAGEIIFEEGEQGKHLYIIEEGQVEIYRMVLGKKKVLSILGPGDIFGEMSVFFDQPRKESARALSRVRAFCFDRRAFEQLIKNNYGIALKIIRMLALRLQEADIHIENLLYRDNESKLVNTLIRAVEEEGIESGGGYILRLTPEQLAMRTDLSIEEMKRILAQLIRAGFISFQKGFFRISDLSRLKRLLNYLELKEEFEPLEKFILSYFPKSGQ